MALTQAGVQAELILRYLWDGYEARNERARRVYFGEMGKQRQIRDQSGRVRATPQIRTPRR